MAKDLKELKPDQPPEQSEGVRIARRALAQGHIRLIVGLRRGEWRGGSPSEAGRNGGAAVPPKKLFSSP